MNHKKYLSCLRKATCVALAACIGMSTAACSLNPNKNKKVSASNFFFDTVITITLYGTQKTAPIEECFSMASEYESQLSNTVAGSEISQINDRAGTGEWTTVSDSTLELIEDGLYYCRLSDGAFDITCGALSSLWNFAEISENLTTDNNETDASVLPTSEEVAQALATVDYTQVEIDGNNVRINSEGTQMDLGGIAKGFIADQMKEYLTGARVSSAIINLGGNVLLVGSKPGGSDFKIGIQKPFDENNSSMAAMSLSDASVVTSGVYERYYRIDGQLYHHLLDLSTGYPCDNGLDSVTIISSSSMDGDALSTTCFALGLDKGMELIESLDGVEAVFVSDDLSIHTSSGVGSDFPFEEVE